MSGLAEQAAAALAAREEIAPELHLPAAVSPLDIEPIRESVARTGQLLVVEEGAEGFDLAAKSLPACASVTGARRRCESGAWPRMRRRSRAPSISSAQCCPARMTSTKPAWSCSMRESSPLPVPQMNVNDEHAVIVAWHVGSGARVEADQLAGHARDHQGDVRRPYGSSRIPLYEHAVKSWSPVGAPLAWIADHADAQIPQQGRRRLPAAVRRAAATTHVSRARHCDGWRARPDRCGFPGGRPRRAAGRRGRVLRARGAGRASDRRGLRREPSLSSSAPSKLLEAARLTDVYRAGSPAWSPSPVRATASLAYAESAERDGPVQPARAGDP